MSYLVSQKKDVVKVVGTTWAANVPDSDVNLLSYYLACGTFFGGWNAIGVELLDYKKVHTLSPDRQDAIFLLAYATFNFSTLLNKTISLDDEHKILPRNVSNQFYELEQVQASLSVQAFVTISGQKKEVRKIMLCTRKWLTKYYEEPLQRNESRLRRIVAADNRRTGNTPMVEKALAAAFNKLIVANKNNSHTIGHTDTAAPIAHAIVSPKFRAGQRSHLIGLVQKPEWNGREVLVKNDLGDGRVIVTFVNGGTNITVNAVNLEPAKEIGIPVNSLVEIHGVNSDRTLNGQLGVVVGAATTGVNWNHVLVQLLNNESRILSLKPEKVRIVENVA